MMPDDYSTFALLGVICCHAPAFCCPHASPVAALLFRLRMTQNWLSSNCCFEFCKFFDTTPMVMVEVGEGSGDVRRGSRGSKRERRREGSAMHSSSSSAIDWRCLANFMTLSHLSRIMLMNQLSMCVCVGQDTSISVCVCTVCVWRL